VTAVGAELRKLLGLPSVRVAVGIGLVAPPLIAGLNASAPNGGPAVDAGFFELAFGAVAAIIIGVVAIGSEYRPTGEDGGRQITTSLTCIAGRLRFLTAKTLAVTVTVALLGAAAAALTTAVNQVLAGARAAPLAEVAPRLPAVVLYWVSTALLAYAITVLTRSGVLPLTVLVVNTSVVSLTYLLAKATALADYLPDRAGARMFLRTGDFPAQLPPLTAGVVMAVWTLLLLAVAARVFTRRDA
jgi:hypothetical protein